MFHYPPNPLSENGLKPTAKGRRGSRAKSTNNDSTSSEESGSSSSEEDENSLVGNGSIVGRRHSNFGIDDNNNVPTSASSIGGESQRPPSLGSGRNSIKRRSATSDVEEDNGSSPEGRENGAGGAYTPPWETLLGLPSDVWEKLLSPSRTWHKRRFEVGINDLAFVGWPVFIREDGTWRKQKRRKKRKPRAEWEGAELGHEEHLTDTPGEDSEAAAGQGPTDVSEKLGASAEGKPGVDAGGDQSDDSPEADKDSMTMFNVVFVMDPPILEYSLRIRENYDNVIKKFAKALKWEQARADYVWQEAQKILHIKEKAREKSMIFILPDYCKQFY